MAVRYTMVVDRHASRDHSTGADQFNALDLTNTVWAFATAGHASPALFDAVAKEAVHRGLREFKLQGRTGRSPYAGAWRISMVILGVKFVKPGSGT